MRIELPDFAAMSDPDFLAERRRVRERYQQADDPSADRTRLGVLRDVLDEEFDRRARAAWSPAVSGDGDRSSHADTRGDSTHG